MPYVKDSQLHGQGVFADRKYSIGDTIELCPYLVTDDDDVGEDCVLPDYMFQSPNDDCEEYLIALGLGMVYNHSSDPNAEWEINEEDNRFIRFVAVKEIKENEEICHDYGDEYWESR